jgi:hypothetical protein
MILILCFLFIFIFLMFTWEIVIEFYFYVMKFFKTEEYRKWRCSMYHSRHGMISKTTGKYVYRCDKCDIEFRPEEIKDNHIYL